MELDAAHRENLANARARMVPRTDGSWAVASTVVGLSERAHALGRARLEWAQIRTHGEISGPWQTWVDWEQSVVRFRRAEREMYPEDLNDRVAAVTAGEPEAVELGHSTSWKSIRGASTRDISRSDCFAKWPTSTLEMQPHPA